ncbi:predicted protein [Histoplasma capsulatum var. duboisii H88]|uniref:Predicted protein n=1 Tax=Ajellomyces capsulatus (strain H88) TaxID=544711 RepID=F0UVN1_AJEC8|nr:predicted protein [Histoplasma capsulatum var. duboisii H88]
MNANERLRLLRAFVKLQLCFRAAAFCSSRRYTTWTVQKRLPKKSRTSDVADLRRSITETEPRSWARQKLLVSVVVHRYLGPGYQPPLAPTIYMTLASQRSYWKSQFESQLESNGEDNHPWLSIAKSADCQMRLSICSVNVFIRSIMIEDKP